MSIRGMTLWILIVVITASCSPTPAPTPTAAPPTASPTLLLATSTQGATSRPTATTTVTGPPIVRSTATRANTLHGPYDEKADAKYDITWALTMARSERKNVILDFGANWCLDCVVLSKIFDDPAVGPALDENFYVVKIDVGKWDKNLDVSQQYGKPIDKGIPAVVVLDPDGHMVATTKNGELANARYSNKQQILEMLRQWAPRKPLR